MLGFHLLRSSFKALQLRDVNSGWLVGKAKWGQSPQHSAPWRPCTPCTEPDLEPRGTAATFSLSLKVGEGDRKDSRYR